MRTNILQVTKSVFAAVVFSLAFVLIFTVIIQFCNLSAAVIKPVNQVFKTLAIALGGIIFLRGEKGWLKGLIHGIIAVVFTYLLFALISMSISISWKFIFELLLGAAAGAISGVIGVNIRVRK